MAGTSYPTPLVFAVGAAVGFALALALSPAAPAAAAKRPEATYDLVVTVTLRDEASAAEFCRRFKVLQDYCRASEPETATYEMFRKDGVEGPQPQFVIVERYTRAAALTEVHHKSAAFVDFRTWLSTSDVMVGKDRAAGTILP